jgi:hypothetical protein
VHYSCNTFKGKMTIPEFQEFISVFTPNDVVEVLKIESSKNGVLKLNDGKKVMMLDENGLVTFGYVDSNS